MAFSEVIWTCLTLIIFFPHCTLVTVIINAYTIFMSLFLGWGKIQLFLCQADAAPCSPGGDRQSGPKASHPPCPGHRPTVPPQRSPWQQPSQDTQGCARDAPATSLSPFAARGISWLGSAVAASSVSPLPSHLLPTPSGPLPLLLCPNSWAFMAMNFFTLPASRRIFFFKIG